MSLISQAREIPRAAAFDNGNYARARVKPALQANRDALINPIGERAWQREEAANPEAFTATHMTAKRNAAALSATRHSTA